MNTINTTNDKNFDIQTANNADIESWKFFLDLPLEISVELGRIKITLQSILDLKSNSILQLKRPAGSAVDIMASGHCIAHGEIIRFEDTLGIRVNEIITPNTE
ncbi:MAG: FliM/FliN family flagellar motor switch protein [Blastocatellia bacterium]